MSYDVSIVPREESQKAARISTESVLLGLPGVRRETIPGVFCYGHPAGRIFVHLYLEGEAEVSAVCLSIAAAHNRKDTVAVVLLLGFRIAEQLGWRVYDEQAGEYFEKDTLESVLKSQRKFGGTPDEILRERADGASTFSQRFFFHLQHPASVSIVVTLFSSAIAAGFLIYHFMLSERSFIWLAMGTAGLILILCAVIQSLLPVSQRK